MLKRTALSSVVVSLLAWQALPAAPISRDDQRIRALSSPDGEARVQASAQLVQLGASIVAPLLGLMDGDDPMADKMAYETLFDLVQRVAGRADARQVEAELIDGLQSDHGEHTHRAICRLLAYVGSEACVDAIYRKVATEEVGEMAIFALARIPGDRASQAIAGAIQLTRGDRKIAVINAMGVRGDATGLGFLARIARDADDPLRTATVKSLASIPVPDQLLVMMHALSNNVPEAETAAVRYVHTLLDTGFADAARRLIGHLDQASSLSPSNLAAVLRAWGRLGGDEAQRRLFAALEHDRPQVRGAALDACVLLDGQSATKAIAQRMASARGRDKVDLLAVLAQRGAWPDEAAAKDVINAVDSADDEVRIAAIKAIEQAGLADGTQALLRVLAGPAGPVRDAAEHAVNHMSGASVTPQIMEAIPQAPPGARAMLVLALGYRGGEEVWKTLVDAAGDKSENVRVAACRALGVLGELDGLPALVTALEDKSGAVRSAAERALRGIDGKVATVRMIDAYMRGPDAVRPALLRAIGYRSHVDIPPILAEAARGDQAELKEAGLTGLERQHDPALAGALLEAAEAGPEPVTRAAMTGYLSAARRQANADRPKAGEMYLNAVRVAVDDKHRRDALAGVIECVDPGRQDVLWIVLPHMSMGGARDEAARAVIHFAVTLPGSDARAADLLKMAIERKPGEEATLRAVRRLRELGIDVDPAHDEGFITKWWLLGPIPNPDNEMWGKIYPPETGDVDPGQPVRIGDKTYTWQRHRTEDLNGIVSLDRVLSDRDYIGAYAYAEISVEDGKDVLLKIGSDDSIVVWINGEKIHAFEGARGVKVDEDQANARLNKGVNRVLVKCLDAIHDWGFCIRVTTPDGKPVEFKQKDE